jgi:hypothetical protein
MSQRNSGKKRQRNELYETQQPWVVLDGLAPHFPLDGVKVLEPACGNGLMVAALEAAGAIVSPADKVLHRGFPLRRRGPAFRQADFVNDPLPTGDFGALVTNPPYGHQGEMACQFIVKGLEFIAGGHDRVMALLLPVDFDSAATRVSLFEKCHAFYGTVVLRRRIEFFPRSRKADGKLSSGPSQNHAWFIWRAPGRRLGSYPIKLYAPAAP